MIPKDKPLIEVSRAAPEVILDIRYARSGGVFGPALYPFAAAFLLPGAAARLAAAAARLRPSDLRLIVLDAYRPLSVQRRLWALKPDSRYVADPRFGSAHNRGAAVDVALADGRGSPLPMPSEFDDLSERSRHDAPQATEEERRNARVLREAMEGTGWRSLAEEWWHYADPELESAPLLDIPFEELR